MNSRFTTLRVVLRAIPSLSAASDGRVRFEGGPRSPGEA